MNRKELLELDPQIFDDFDERLLTQEEILSWFDLFDAAWVHNGDPKMPHAELASGLCSNAYFNCPKILC
jgi:hypothetical protein